MLPTYVAAMLALAISSEGTPPIQTPSFRVGIELPCQVPTSVAVERALKTMGVQYVNYYLRTALGIKDRPHEEIHPHMLELCRRLGVDYSIATHQIDPPDEAVRAAVAASAQPNATGRFRGVVVDELEHIRLLNYLRPEPLADYKGFRSLNQAWRETVDGFGKLRGKYAALGSPLIATHVFPVLLHAAARSGCIVCPKLCKEFYSPVSLAIGMGAAKQYKQDLWADIDLWYWAMIPGHSPEEFRCNLLLAYWLGVDLAYVEGAGFNLLPAGDQGYPFTLVSVAGPERYQLTPHGEALRWFARDYVPKNPRPYTFRDVRPTSAIIRFEDTDHGLRATSGFTPGLYGTTTLLPSADTEAWFGLWNLLTAGRTNTDGLSFFKARTGMTAHQRDPDPGEYASYATRPVQAEAHSFFVPLNNVVVYDHTVGYDLIKDIPVLWLTGVAIEPATMEAIRRRVHEGATCIVWGPLARRSGFADWQEGTSVRADGKGTWVITDNWSDSKVFEKVWMHVGRSDEIRYTFGEHTVVLRWRTDNEIDVELNGVRK